ncbi:TetR/AcrR family transcriptional regulator [Actinomadura opuntiae]|uniref:TetR/AcrR family transcriptional regulator n=1 Tax=Actinomadura sp. OS1-43 TaxID=604315 RepID=UPI00255AF9BE|nr:TetR/AcrR family transcriptional regulator [Actinomadura sp. OS1-43]MDL4817226.1 TetR/AcrR family transcriptional regulator [Actinomadura sp. OS1-43]
MPIPSGHRALTMEGIARRAGVSKQTLYRWWSSPAQILLEALNEGAEQIAPLEETGDLEADLRRFAHSSILGARGPVARLLTTLMAEAQRDPAFGKAFRAGFLAHRRSIMLSLLNRAADRGDISPDADLDLAVEAFYGTLWYRLLSGSGPIDEHFADDLTRLTLTHLHRPGPVRTPIPPSR